MRNRTKKIRPLSTPRATTAWGSTQLLTVLGAINWDISIFEERFAKRGEEVPVNLVEEFSGGKGANVAVAAARILGRGRVAFVGALGDDDISKKQLQELKAEGVITDGIVEVKESQSGRAYIIIDGAGMKTIHTHFGANEKVTVEHLTGARVARAIQASRMIIVMDTPTEVGRKAIEIAKRNRSRVVYSPGVRTQGGILNLGPLLESADYIVLDRIELRNLSPRMDEEEISHKLTSANRRLTVVETLGEKGCAITAGGRTTIVRGVDVESLGKRVVNTTGCGDAFLGVFAGYLLLGSSILEAAKRANLAGALKATKYETRGSPTRAELEKEETIWESVRQTEPGLQLSRGV